MTVILLKGMSKAQPAVKRARRPIRPKIIPGNRPGAPVSKPSLCGVGAGFQGRRARLRRLFYIGHDKAQPGFQPDKGLNKIFQREIKLLLALIERSFAVQQT